MACSPKRHQAIIWTNAGILLIGPLGTNFSEILIEIQTFFEENTFENVVCEMLFISSRPQCVNLISYRCYYWGSHDIFHIYHLNQFSDPAKKPLSLWHTKTHELLHLNPPYSKWRLLVYSNTDIKQQVDIQMESKLCSVLIRFRHRQETVHENI